MEQTTIKKLLTVYRLKIPDFQRHFVWKLSKKQQLLDSLFRGFPIGAITLYEDENIYYIIDGLQRINTLNQYLSRPSEVIPFHKFYAEIEHSMKEFLAEQGLLNESDKIKKCVKAWYEGLTQLYEFEKVSVLYNILKKDQTAGGGAFSDLRTVEELLGILVREIEIANDSIALIIYRGDKNDLPELFKNINTGSVALSQYEILQSVWNDYLLDGRLLSDTFDAFNRELKLISNDYEIGAVRERGKFDIFKNIVGLNHILCCSQDSGEIFHFSTFKRLTSPVPFDSSITKYYSNDGIAFELYSTILCNTSNQIIKAVDLIYKGREHDERISGFVTQINQVIIEAVETAVKEVRKAKTEVIESKYHSLYILMGIIFSRYEVDVENLTVQRTAFHEAIFQECLDLKKHIANKWFVDENRQIGFFNIKIGELLDLKKTGGEGNTVSGDGITLKQAVGKSGLLEIIVNGDRISAFTVKDFYRKIFTYLLEHEIDFEEYVPFATGKKRYLVNRTARHINGNIFVSPITVEDYFIETHKSKTGALMDICKFLRQIGADVEYV